MLNSKALSDLLSKNVHPTISPRWFIMTPNATLLAYSTPHAVKQTRDQAALLSMLWKEHSNNTTASTSPKTPLETLTIEFPDGNVIVRAVQPQLLLVLVGGTWTPSRPGEPDLAAQKATASLRRFRITPESKGGERYVGEASARGEQHGSQNEGGAGGSDDGEVERDGEGRPDDDDNKAGDSDDDDALRVALLRAQRDKVDAATEHLRADFGMKGFVMPGEGGGGEI